MNSVSAIRLSVMMFIQFFIWGAWYVTAPRYLGQIGFGGNDFGWTYSAGPIAAMISPFIVGMIADRFFSTERVLGVMHLLAGGAMLAATTVMKSDAPSPNVINGIFFFHMLCYTEKEFPIIRVFGTIGWIVAGIVLAFSSTLVAGSNWSNDIEMFYLAGGAGIVLGLYSFTLPHTPPPSAGKQVSLGELFGADALVLLKKPSFFVFMASSLLICIPLAFYYQMAERTVAQAGIADPAFKMTFGQMSEIIFMLLMPLFFARLGVKWMLFVGMLAWVVRYGLFALGAPDGVAWMILLGVTLHGICYDFFFVTGQIYTDKVAPDSIRSQAQGMLVLFTLGLGMFIGAKTAGYIENSYTPPETAQLLEQAGTLGKQIDDLKASGADVSAIDELQVEKDAASLKALQAIQWKQIWTIPCIGAAVIMIIFALAFRDDAKKVSKSTAEDKQPADG
jgi:nucleoside transporter